MAGANSHVSLVLKGLPWLKRLQGSLEDDDSSDSSSQLAPKQMGIKQEKVKGRGRYKETRRRRPDDHSEGASSTQFDASRETKKRQIKKAVRGPGTRSAEERCQGGKRTRSPVSKAKAAAQRGQWMPKPRALRVSITEPERIVALKLKRQPIPQACKTIETDGKCAVRAARGVYAGAEADVEEIIQPRRRVRGENRHNAERSVPIGGRTVVQDALKQTVSPAVAIEKGSSLVNATARTMNFYAITTCSVAGRENNDDDNKIELATSTASSPEGKNKRYLPSPAITVTTSGHAKAGANTGECFAAISKRALDHEVTEGNGKVEFNAVECGRSETIFQEEIKDTAAKSENPLSTSSGGKEQVIAEPTIVSDVAVKPVTNPITKATQIRSPVVDALSVTIDTEKKLVSKVLLHDAMPIPKKLPKDGGSGDSCSTISFVIPKRSLGQTDIAVEPSGRVERANSAETKANDDGKRYMEAIVAVPLATSKSSSNVIKGESTRLQSRRSKTAVPVRRASLSTQDRALMRLSRKRNSIFMASTELAAQGSDGTVCKAGLVTHLMEYEVCNADGTTLPDLIPRRSCATKRELASDQASYTSSFFGVSRMAPKAKSSCEFVGCVSRKLNCYEELRFKRPEDREFYQHKLYGTAFVPQNLRGWMTLIVRRAHFERKSTGIRFNQDRDRESFAAALSQRYTLNKSIPRCDIPRDNWQRLTKNELGTVLLHYYNREDAERASKVFCDDLGQPLQIRRELKAGARIQVSSSPLSESTFQETPRRSTSNEWNAPEPSPLSSQSGNARNFLSRRQDFDSFARSDRQYSRYDRGHQLVPSARDEIRNRPFFCEKKRSRAFIERRSQSRTRDGPYLRRNYEASVYDNRGGSEVSARHLPISDIRATFNDSHDNAAISNYSNVAMAAQKRPRKMSPHRSPNIGLDGSKCEEGEEGEVEGEAYRRVKSNVTSTPRDRAVCLNDGDSINELQRLRSPSRRWEKGLNYARPHNSRAHYSSSARYSKESTFAQHFSGQQQYSRDSGNASSRSRSRPRSSLPVRKRHDYRGDRCTGTSRHTFRRADSNIFPRER